jgi:lipoprotein
MSKYIYYKLTLLFCLLPFFALISCEETKEEEGLVRAFLRSQKMEEVEKKELQLYEYINGERLATIYEAVMDSKSPLRPWEEFSNDFGTGLYEDSGYLVKPRKTHLHRIREGFLTLDSKQNFQVDFHYDSVLPSYFEGYYYAGIVFNYSEKNDGYTFSLLLSGDNTYTPVLVDNNKGVIRNFTKQKGIPRSCLLSIRKIGDNMAFFVDKKFVGSHTYKEGGSSSIGYYVNVKCTLQINSLSIYNIEPKVS